MTATAVSACHQPKMLADKNNKSINHFIKLIGCQPTSDSVKSSLAVVSSIDADSAVVLSNKVSSKGRLSKLINMYA
jgi:hypothetical protein